MVDASARSAIRALNVADKTYYFVVTVLAILAFLVVSYPMYFVIIASFSDASMVNQGQVVFFPKQVNWLGYQRIFENSEIWIGYKNTILYSVFGTALNLAVTLPAAYALSRKLFRPRRVIMVLFVFTMYFSGGMVPTYMLVKSLHLLNTPWIMIIMGALNVFNLIITRTFFESSIPEELYEAAVLDGCSHFRYFSTIVLPLSKAVIAVITLYYLVGHWNSFFTPLLYLNSDSLQPLQIVLRDILLSNQAMAGTTGDGASGYAQQAADQMKYGVIIVSSLPVLCVYPFIQKYFEKGALIGAVKG